MINYSFILYLISVMVKCTILFCFYLLIIFTIMIIQFFFWLFFF